MLSALPQGYFFEGMHLFLAAVRVSGAQAIEHV